MPTLSTASKVNAAPGSADRRVCGPRLFGVARSNSGSQIGRYSDPVNDQATTLDLLRRA